MYGDRSSYQASTHPQLARLRFWDRRARLPYPPSTQAEGAPLYEGDEQVFLRAVPGRYWMKRTV